MPLTGSLNARGLPVVELTVRGPWGWARLPFIVDTGFTGATSLPADTVQKLGLLRHNVRATVLADGTVRIVRVFLVDVEWLGGATPAEALESPSRDATLGAGLLRGCTLAIDYGPAQAVEIR